MGVPSWPASQSVAMPQPAAQVVASLEYQRGVHQSETALVPARGAVASIQVQPPGHSPTKCHATPPRMCTLSAISIS